MGWCSATEIFDTVVSSIIEGHDKKKAIKDLINILEAYDWDCQYESEFINNKVVQECFIELDPETWKEYFNDLL